MFMHPRVDYDFTLRRHCNCVNASSGDHKNVEWFTRMNDPPPYEGLPPWEMTIFAVLKFELDTFDQHGDRVTLILC